MHVTDFQKLEAIFLELAEKASAAIMLHAHKRDASTRLKADNSPVTAADLAANIIICDGLSKIFPNIPIISEESPTPLIPIAQAHDFFLVDPLDGTKEFIKGCDEFTVNIALVRKGQPIRGVISAPALEQCFFTNAEGTPMQICKKHGQQKLKMPPLSSLSPPQKMRIVMSSSHPTPEDEAYINLYDFDKCFTIGSSFKFCILASGKAELYPRLSPTMEWDTAAGHAILAAAKGKVVDIEKGSSLTYGKKNFKNTPFLAHIENIKPKGYNA